MSLPTDAAPTGILPDMTTVAPESLQDLDGVRRGVLLFEMASCHGYVPVG